MEQPVINNTMDKNKPVKPVKTKPGKWPILSKFLKDVGHFVFNEESASDELKRDLTILEKTRAEEREQERLAKMTAEQKLAEEQAKIKALKQTEEINRKKKEEADKLAKLNKDKAKKMSFKTRLANHFKKERESFEERQQAIAEHLLKTKGPQATPASSGLAVAPKVPAPTKSSWFKTKPSAEPIKTELTDNLSANRLSVDKTAFLSNSQKTKPTSDKNAKDQNANKFKEERIKHQNLSQKEQVENRSWQPFGVVHTNLIREHRGMFLNWQSKILWLLLFVALAGLISIAVYGFLLILEKDKISSSQSTFANLSGIVSQIQSEEVFAEEILNFNNKLLAVDYLLSNHIYWTNLFQFLEDYTIKDAYYERFSGDLSGKYILPTVAKDYRSVTSQLRVLQSATDKVMSVDAGGAESANKTAALTTPNSVATSTPDNTNVKFNLNLNLNRSIFIKEPQYVE